jgi:membrane-bound ClpP family serine protease
MAEPQGSAPTAGPPGGKTAAARERAALAELVEVERALAALEGRNVEDAEHLVTQRRDAEKRRAAIEQIIAASRAEMARQRRLLPYKIAASPPTPARPSPRSRAG